MLRNAPEQGRYRERVCCVNQNPAGQPVFVSKSVSAGVLGRAALHVELFDAVLVHCVHERTGLAAGI